MRHLIAVCLLAVPLGAQVIIGGFSGAGGGGGGGTTETAQNVGAGTFYFFKQKTGDMFQFYTFDVTAPIEVALAADKLTFSCPTCLVSTGSYSAPSWLTGLQPTSEKNAANGYAGLTAGTKLIKAQGDEVWSLVDLADVANKRGDATSVQMTSGSVATDDCAKFDAAGNLVSAGAACGTGLANTSHAFTSQTSVTLTHSRNSTNVIVSCYGPGDIAIGYNSLTVTDANNVAVTFASPQTGRCVVNSSGGGGGGGGGGVSQVNGTANEIDVANPTTTPTLSLSPTIDLSTKTATKTMKTGTAAPGTCSVGELFFDTDATPGSNIYACTATDTWTLQAGGNSVANTDHTFTAQTSVVLNHALNTTRILVQCYDATTNGNAIGFNSLTVTDANNVTVGFASPQTGRCVVNGGSGGVGGGGATDLISLSDVTGKQGNGTVVPMYAGSAPANNDCAKFDASGNLTTAGSACGAGGGGTPGGSNGQVQYNNAGAFGGLALGFGLRINSGNLEVNPSTVPTYLTATAALNFGSIPANTCSELTITLTGAAVGDAVIPSYPNAMEAGLLGNMFVSATNTVTVRLCKVTTGSVDPADANFTATIVRSF